MSKKNIYIDLSFPEDACWMEYSMTYTGFALLLPVYIVCSSIGIFRQLRISGFSHNSQHLLGIMGISCTMMMHMKTLRIVVVLMGCVLLGLTGCDPERITSPILPGETSVLMITFMPSPVYENSSSKYRFTIFVDEVNGVGARITSMKVENIDNDGDVLDTDHYDEGEVIQTFGTSRIEAYGRLMANVELECYGCARENWILRATDDRGNYVEYSQSVALISR